MECELQQSYVLNRFRFDGLDPSDVKEVILIVVDKIAFHLRRRHSTVRLRHVNHRQIQVRENIDRHSQDRENRTQRHPNHQHNDRNRIPKRAAEKPHCYFTPGVACRDSKKGRRSPSAAATEARFCQTARRARALSISDCTSKPCASETSTSVASPD